MYHIDTRVGLLQNTPSSPRLAARWCSNNGSFTAPSRYRRIAAETPT